MATGYLFWVVSVLYVAHGAATAMGDREMVRVPFLPRPPLGTPVDPEVFMNTVSISPHYVIWLVFYGWYLPKK